MTLFPRPLVNSLALALLGFVASPLAASEGPLDAKTVATTRQLVEAAKSDTGAYALVESLTTEVGPRMAGTPAFDRAVEWAQARFKALGYDRVYLEPVSYPTWHFNVRGSNTEPLLRLNLESIASREEMEQKRDEVLAIIRG